MNNEYGSIKKGAAARGRQRRCDLAHLGLVFQMLIDKEPFKEALFGLDSIVFLVIITIAEVVLYYLRQARGTKKN